MIRKPRLIIQPGFPVCVWMEESTICHLVDKDVVLGYNKLNYFI